MSATMTNAGSGGAEDVPVGAEGLLADAEIKAELITNGRYICDISRGTALRIHGADFRKHKDNPRMGWEGPGVTYDEVLEVEFLDVYWLDTYRHGVAQNGERTFYADTGIQGARVYIKETDLDKVTITEILQEASETN
jgi:hypothetical protein